MTTEFSAKPQTAEKGRYWIEGKMESFRRETFEIA
jgi:hypothetical protein